MAKIPQLTKLDSTMELMRIPYKFISKSCKQLNSEIFATRIMFQKTICMTGQDASKLFYTSENIIRKGAAPEMLKATLLGKGGVSQLDGEAHLHRKKLFMEQMTPEKIDELTAIAHNWLQVYASSWEQDKEQVILYKELQTILTRSVCEWVGVPLEENEVDTRRDELVAMFDRAGAKGIGHLWSRIERKRAEAWIEEVVNRTRAGSIKPKNNSPLFAFCWHRDLNGKLMDAHMTAIELLNLLRPTVAVSLFMVFVVHALYAHPEFREKIVEASDEDLNNFVQEVRRLYPFFPATMAKVGESFEWKGFTFKKGTRVMLDVYGINHSEAIWGDPETFRPERFASNPPTPFNFVPQGGGDHLNAHRCAGEFITVELMKTALEFFATEINYDVPKQDIYLDFARLPAMPKSRMIIENVSLNTLSNIEIDDLPSNDFFIPANGAKESSHEERH